MAATEALDNALLMLILAVHYINSHRSPLEDTLYAQQTLKMTSRGWRGGSPEIRGGGGGGGQDQMSLF